MGWGSRAKFVGDVDMKKKYFKGTIVEQSLTGKEILSNIHILKSWHDQDWVLYSVQVEKSAGIKFSEFLKDGPWYMHFWEESGDEMIIVFKNKNFLVSRSNKSTWGEAITYGSSINIPIEQLERTGDEKGRPSAKQ